MAKKFTVIVLVYNNSEYLEESINSILIQDYTPLEIIVVDDGSEKFEKEKIISYISGRNDVDYIVYQNSSNLGTVKSAKNAIMKASGEYIKLLAADDALYDRKSLSSAADALNHSPCGIITGDVMNCNANLEPQAKNYKKLMDRINTLEPFEVFKALCVHNDIVAGGVFFKRSFFDEYGMFDESFRLLEDWPTWLRATRAGCRVVHVPFYAIRYRLNNGVGTSTNSIYINDRKKVFDSIILPARKEIGLWIFLKSFFYNSFCNSFVVRKIYGCIFRRK